MITSSRIYHVIPMIEKRWTRRNHIIHMLISSYRSDEKYVFPISNVIGIITILDIAWIGSVGSWSIGTYKVFSLRRERKVVFLISLLIHHHFRLYIFELLFGILFILDIVRCIRKMIAVDTVMTSDEVRREPNIATIEDKSRVEDKARTNYTIWLIDVFTIIPYHHAVVYISTVFLDFKWIENIFDIIESDIEIAVMCPPAWWIGIVWILDNRELS